MRMSSGIRINAPSAPRPRRGSDVDRGRTSILYYGHLTTVLRVGRHLAPRVGPPTRWVATGNTDPVLTSLYLGAAAVAGARLRTYHSFHAAVPSSDRIRDPGDRPSSRPNPYGKSLWGRGWPSCPPGTWAQAGEPVISPGASVWEGGADPSGGVTWSTHSTVAPAWVGRGRLQYGRWPSLVNGEGGGQGLPNHRFTVYAGRRWVRVTTIMPLPSGLVVVRIGKIYTLAPGPADRRSGMAFQLPPAGSCPPGRYDPHSRRGTGKGDGIGATPGELRLVEAGPEATGSVTAVVAPRGAVRYADLPRASECGWPGRSLGGSIGTFGRGPGLAFPLFPPVVFVIPCAVMQWDLRAGGMAPFPLAVSTRRRSWKRP